MRYSPLPSGIDTLLHIDCFFSCTLDKQNMLASSISMLFSSIVIVRVFLLPLAASRLVAIIFKGNCMSDTFCCLNQNLDRSAFLQQKKHNFCLQLEHRWIVSLIWKMQTIWIRLISHYHTHFLYILESGLKPPRNPKILLTKKWTPDMSFLFFPAWRGRLPRHSFYCHDSGGREKTSSFWVGWGLDATEVLPLCLFAFLAHCVTRHAMFLLFFLGVLVEGRVFLVKRRDHKSKEREMERGLENWLSLYSMAFRFLEPQCRTCFWISDWWINMRHIFSKFLCSANG